MLETEMAGLKFKNPLIAGCAGITATAEVIKKWLDVGAGGILGKTISADPSDRIWIRPYFYVLEKQGFKGTFTDQETPSWIPPDVWAEKEAPKIEKLCKKHDARWIQSIKGKGPATEDWRELARLVEDSGADGVELDVSCPILMAGGEIEIGEDPPTLARIVKAVRDEVKIPVGVKLTCTVRPIDKIAQVAEAAGADYASCINNPPGIAINVEREEVIGAPDIAGLVLGRYLKFIGQYKVFQVATACKFPVSGIGGIWTAEDALEYMLLGCPTFQMVTSIYFKGRNAITNVLNGIKEFMEKKGYTDINEFRGKILRQLTETKVPKEKGEMKLEPSALIPLIDAGKCNFCKICVEPCIHDALKANEDTREISVDENKCHGCGFCVGICPQDAIQIVHAKTKSVVWDGKGSTKIDWVEW